MKFSIVVGVAHMTLGILMKASNAIYSRNKIDLLFEAIP